MGILCAVIFFATFCNFELAMVPRESKQSCSPGVGLPDCLRKYNAGTSGSRDIAKNSF